MADQASKGQLLPWIKNVLDSGSIRGAEWLNEQKTKFRIPWYHQNHPSWTQDRGQIYKKWDVWRGRSQETDAPEDLGPMKHRLRSALRKCEDIKELENESKPNKEHADPHRVFEICPRKGSGKKKNKPVRTVNDAIPGGETVSPLVAQIPTFLEDFTENSGENLPSDLNISNGQLFKGNINISPYMEGSLSSHSIQIDLSNSAEQKPVADDKIGEQLSADLSSMIIDESVPAMTVRVYYYHQEVFSHQIRNKNGFVLVRDDDNLVPAIAEANKPEFIKMPRISESSQFQESQLFKLKEIITKGMEGGIQIGWRGKDILAASQCQCLVFRVSHLTNSQFVELPRGECVELFNYASYLQPVLQAPSSIDVSVPDPKVYLAVYFESVEETVPVYITIESNHAVDYVNQCILLRANPNENESSGSIMMEDYSSLLLQHTGDGTSGDQVNDCIKPIAIPPGTLSTTSCSPEAAQNISIFNSNLNEVEDMNFSGSSLLEQIKDLNNSAI